jgi:hypothetical protein
MWRRRRDAGDAGAGGAVAPGGVDRAASGLAHALAASTTRRSFLGRVSAGVMALLGVPLAATVPVPARGDVSDAVPGTEPAGSWFGFCGHYWTTGSCPGPFHFPRVDDGGRPLRPSDGRPVDDLGRLVDAGGRPVDEAGRPLLAPDGLPLPRAPRTRLCEDWAVGEYGLNAVTQGSWYRCCNGVVRRLADCCSTSRRRINGDTALVGYCHGGRTVFCVVYMETGVPC